MFGVTGKFILFQLVILCIIILQFIFNYNTLDSTKLLIQDIQNAKFPQLETIDKSVFLFENLKRSFEDSIISQDLDLLEETQSSSSTLSDNLKKVISIELKNQTVEQSDFLLEEININLDSLNKVLKSFNQFYNFTYKSLYQSIDQEEDLMSMGEKNLVISQSIHKLTTQLKQIRNNIYGRYISSVEDIEYRSQLSNEIGVSLIIIFLSIGGLVALWFKKYMISPIVHLKDITKLVSSGQNIEIESSLRRRVCYH